MSCESLLPPSWMAAFLVCPHVAKGPREFCGFFGFVSFCFVLNKGTASVYEGSGLTTASLSGGPASLTPHTGGGYISTNEFGVRAHIFNQ